MNNLKNKVIAKLIANGNNVNDVQEMVNLHFETASKKFTKVSEICNFIRIVY